MRQKLKGAIQQLSQLHRFSQNVLHGCCQLAVILCLIALLLYLALPILPDYFTALRYAEGLAEMAPATLVVGVIAALLSDLILRRGNDDD